MPISPSSCVCLAFSSIIISWYPRNRPSQTLFFALMFVDSSFPFLFPCLLPCQPSAESNALFPQDLCAPCLKSASDLPPPSPRSVSHERVWEWHPLPFLAHIKAAVVGDIASLRARSPDGAIDSAGRSTLRSALAIAFWGLMRGGVLLGDAPEPIRSFFTGLLLQSIARLIGEPFLLCFDLGSRLPISPLPAECNHPPRLLFASLVLYLEPVFESLTHFL